MSIFFTKWYFYVVKAIAITIDIKYIAILICYSRYNILDKFCTLLDTVIFNVLKLLHVVIKSYSLITASKYNQQWRQRVCLGLVSLGDIVVHLPLYIYFELQALAHCISQQCKVSYQWTRITYLIRQSESYLLIY